MALANNNMLLARRHPPRSVSPALPLSLSIYSSKRRVMGEKRAARSVFSVDRHGRRRLFFGNFVYFVSVYVCESLSVPFPSPIICIVTFSIMAFAKANDHLGRPRPADHAETDVMVFWCTRERERSSSWRCCWTCFLFWRLGRGPFRSGILHFE